MSWTGGDMAKELQKHRALLLACEAIGWLHMAGKARVEFLREKAGQPSGYDDLKWHEKERPPFEWDDLLRWVKDAFDEIDGVNLNWPNTLTHFITKQRDYGGSGMLGLLQAGHGMASGIEKNLPDATSKYLNQDATHLWLSSAFGQPIRNLLLDPPEVLTAAGWKRLLIEMRRILEELQSLGAGNTADVEAWRRWREAAIGPGSYLRQAFSATLAETRLPNNDVTLWDQSYVAAALFKSAVAGAILEGIAFPWTDGQIKQKTRWRLLTVGLGADHYEARAVRIGDWTGSHRALDDFFERVRTLVEVDLALGSLLYRDGTVQVFSFPAQREDGTEPAALNREKWQTWLQAEIDRVARDLDLETPPHCRISAPTRSLVPMTAEIDEVKATLAIPLHRTWDVDNGEMKGHVCPVCLVRHTGQPNDKQQPCGPCRDRRTHRLDDWLGNRTDGDTIWISELADANDRVALVTLSLDLEPWLNGERLDALRTQAIPEWRKHNPTLASTANPVDPAIPFASLVTYVKGKLDKYDKQDSVLRSLQEGYQHEKNWPTFFAKVVEDRAPAPVWDQLDADSRARWLVHQLFRKLPSPGRVYRFWRQAEEFFTELLAAFREIASREENRWRTRRLVLEAADAPNNGWRDREVYAGRWSDRPAAPIDLLYRGDSDGFITAANLARLLKANESGQVLKGATITLRDDKGHESTLKVDGVRESAGALGVYHPVIPLELSPVRFRILLPLDAASACVDCAVERWNELFARVWDRLPLRVGVVAFTRMTPFQAVIEAARNLEDDLSNDEERPWGVVESHVRDGLAALLLARPDGGRKLVMVPVALPDGRPDDHYAYVAVTDREERRPRDFTVPPLQNRPEQVYRHVSDLAPGDGVAVAPSRLAITFMDSTARRFERAEISYLSEWRRLRETWDLLCRTAPSVTALRGAWAALADARARWNAGGASADASAAWASLARSVLANNLGASPPELDALVEAAVSGVLERTLEWHLRILKLDMEGRR